MVLICRIANKKTCLSYTHARTHGLSAICLCLSCTRASALSRSTQLCGRVLGSVAHMPFSSCSAAAAAAQFTRPPYTHIGYIQFVCNGLIWKENLMLRCEIKCLSRCRCNEMRSILSTYPPRQATGVSAHTHTHAHKHARQTIDWRGMAWTDGGWRAENLHRKHMQRFTKQKLHTHTIFDWNVNRTILDDL